MGFSDIFKGLILPGLIALALYLLATQLLLPLYRAHRARYADYLPLQTITSTSTTLRDRLSAALANRILPAHMRWRREGGGGARRESGDGSEFGEEEGESMVGFDFRPGREGRGEDRGWGGREREVMDSQRRLSRDLEEGFKDESEDEEEEQGDDRRRGRS